MNGPPHSLRNTLRPAGSPIGVCNTSFSNRRGPLGSRKRRRRARRALQPVDAILTHRGRFYRRLMNIVAYAKETVA